MNTQESGSLIADHPHPQPGLYRLQMGLIMLALLVIALAVAALALLAFSGLPLLLPIAALLLLLGAPLWMATAAHPPLAVYTRGLRLRPLVGRAQFVPWEAITGIETHHLLPPDEAGRRLLVGRRKYKPREGQVILVRGTLPVQYRLLGLLNGQGLRPAFGISSTTHADYASLLKHIQKQLVIDL